jgi:hypothetical protein
MAGLDPAIHDDCPATEILRQVAYLLRLIMDARVKPAHDKAEPISASC